jgi:glucosylceramidase
MYRRALFLFFVILTICPAQTVNVWLTTDDQKTLMQQQASLAFSPISAGSVPSIVVSDTSRYQAIEGFGGSMTDSAAYLLNEKVPALARSRVLESLFGRGNGIGISFLRNPMGATDITRWNYSYDGQPMGMMDPQLAGFSIAHDQVDIIPMLAAAKAINPQLKMLASPWSAPAWMKSNASMIGGTLLNENYASFTNYLIKYLQAYSAAGMPVDYLTIQHEPLCNPPDYPGSSMPAVAQTDFIRNYVIPALQANGLGTKLLVYDHNWDVPSYPETVLGDRTIASSPLVGGVAWHWYAGTPGVMTTLHNLYPKTGQYVTEASGGSWNKDEVKSDFEVITHSMRNWAKSYVKWSLALDENRGPGVCPDCTGLITVNENTGDVSYNIDYYTLGHFSKFVLPGATRVWSSNAAGLISAAFVNPDGQSRVVVVYNDSSSDRSFQVVWNGLAFNYFLPALSGATFEWTAERTPQDAGYSIPATEQIQASSYNKVSGLQTESTVDVDAGFDLAYATDGSWAEYRNIDFGAGVKELSARVASGGSGGTIEFRTGSPTGQVVASVSVPVTGNWQTWTTVSVPVSNVTGRNDLCVVFRTNGGPNGIGNLNWFRFY